MRPTTLAGWILWILINGSFLPAQNSPRNLIVVIIDGARYSETFGDPNRTYIPEMSAIAQQGALVNTFYNDSLTYTSRAIPALWCGSWTDVQDTVVNGFSTQYTRKPTLFEYYRKQANLPVDSVYYVLKYISSLWLPSFHPEYGPDYWPTFESEGSSDQDVLDHILSVMETAHPRLLWVYLADVDHAGHSGDWAAYTHAIQVADSIVGAIWTTVQQDAFYAGRTNLLVTNDHGRHDDLHGGFSGHGDGCDGCRHIMLLARGPDIQPNIVTQSYRRTPDFAVTACQLLQVQPEYATGEVIQEIFVSSNVSREDILPGSFQLGQNYPNPFNGLTRIPFSLTRQSPFTLSIYNLQGQVVTTVVNAVLSPGEFTVTWNGTDNQGDPIPSGLYLYVGYQGHDRVMRKLILLQ